MDELKNLLDEARASGANEAQLQGIVDAYNAKKKSPESDNGLPNAAGTFIKPAPSSAPADGTSLLDQGKATIDSIQDGTVQQQPDLPQASIVDNGVGSIPLPGETATTVQELIAKGIIPMPESDKLIPALNAKINVGISKFSDALSGVAKLAQAVNNATSFGNKVNPAGQNANQAPSNNIFDDLSAWLKKSSDDNPLPDNLPSQVLGSVAETVPTILGTVATGGASAEGELAADGSRYLTNSEFLQNALTKATGPLTRWLGATGAGAGFKAGYDESGGKLLPTLLGGIKGGGEGIEEGFNLETQMAAGDVIGGSLFKLGEKLGVVNEDGVVTKQALKSAIGSPVAFATASAADDITHGRPVDWKNAGISAATALPYEGEHLLNAFEEGSDIKDQKQQLDDHIGQMMNIADNNTAINFMTADPQDIARAMDRPESSQQLQILSLGKGVEAQRAETLADKNSLHMEQLELQQQADIKRVGEAIVESGPDGFLEAAQNTDLPQSSRDALVNNANFVNKAFNPVERVKTDLGNEIGRLDGGIKDVQDKMKLSQDPADHATHLADLNDLVGQRVAAQMRIFDLTQQENNRVKDVNDPSIREEVPAVIDNSSDIKKKIWDADPDISDYLSYAKEKLAKPELLDPSERESYSEQLNHPLDYINRIISIYKEDIEENNANNKESHNKYNRDRLIYLQKIADKLKAIDSDQQSNQLDNEQGTVQETNEAPAAGATAETAADESNVEPENGNDVDATNKPAPETGSLKPFPLTNPDLGDVSIVDHKESGALTLKMDDGALEDVQPEDFKTLGITPKDVNGFRELNGLDIGADEGPSLSDKINDLAARIAKGETEFSHTDTVLHSNYPDEVENEVRKIKSGVTEDAEPTAEAQASVNDDVNNLSQEQIESVHNAFAHLFPGIKTHFYDSAEAFNEDAKNTSLKRAVERGDRIHAFVDENREIHFNPDFMTADTQLHEQGHILTSWAYHYAPELWNRMIEAGKSMGDVHNELRTNGYDLRGNNLFEEAFVTALGRSGENRLDEIFRGPEKRTRLQKLIHDAWTQFERWVTGKTGFAISKGKFIDQMSVPDFIDYVNDKFQLSDVKISDINSADLSEKNRLAREQAQISRKAPERKKGEPLRDYIERRRKWEENRKAEPEVSGEGPVRPIDVEDADQSESPPWEVAPETRSEFLTRKWQDYLNRAKKAQETIERAGGRINESNDFYHASDLQAAKAANAQRELYEQMVHSVEKNKPAFFERLHDAGISKDDFDKYLQAKHAPEYNQEVANRRRAAYHAELDRLESNKAEADRKGNDKSSLMNERLINNIKNQLNSKYLLMDDGAAGMTNEQARAIMDKFTADGKTPLLDQFQKEFVKDVSNKQLKVQLDSGVIDRDTHDMLMKKFQHYVPFHVEQYLDKKNGINSGKSMTRVDNIIRRAKGSDRNIDERVAPSTYGIVQLEKAHIEGEKNKTLNKLYDQVEQNPNDNYWEIVSPKYSPTLRKDGSVASFKEITPTDIVKNSVQLYRDGRKMYIHLKDPTLLRAIRRDGIQRTIPVLDKIQGYFRAVSTVYSPEFWATNAMKHVEFGALNLTADGQRDIAFQMAKDSPFAMKAAFDFERGNRDGKWAPVIDRYLAAGGKLTGIAPASDIEKIRSIQKIVDSIGKKKSLLQNTKDLIHWISAVGDASGVGPRVAIFKAALDKGMTDQEAATLSREVTVNFNKKGELSGLAGNFYLMFNAGIQGKAYIVKQLATKPVYRKIYGGIFVAGFLNAAMNAAFSSPDDDPVSEYEKENNFILRMPGQKFSVKIPSAWGLNVPYYIGTKLYETMMGTAKPGETTMHVANSIFNAGSPLTGPDLLQTMMPTLLKAGLQYAENKNNFGSPIYKDPDKFGVRQPSSHTHFSGTDQTFVKLAQGLNSMTGGTGVKSGWIDLSPDVMQWMYNTGTGGLGTTAEDAKKTAVSGTEHLAQQMGFMPDSVALQPMDVGKVPFLRKFYTDGTPVNFKSTIFSTLDKSGNTVIDSKTESEFNQALMGATMKGQITPKQFKQYMDMFIQNQLRLQIGDDLPDMERTEIDMVKKKRK